MGKKESWFYTIIRFQTASIIATAADFGTFNLLTYVFGVYYLASNICAAATGATVNFIISTSWTFPNSKNSLKSQMMKYIIVSAGSLLLNTFLLYLFTSNTELDHNISKIIIAIFIALTYNLLLMKYYVFRK